VKKRRVEFLRFFNDYRMLSIFTIDVIGVFFTVFIFLWTVLTIGGMKLIITILSSFGLAFTTTYFYKKSKGQASKGFLKHWFFNTGLYRLNKDKKKWKELEFTDNDDYFPTVNDKFFSE